MALIIIMTGIHSMADYREIQHIDDLLPSRLPDLMQDGAVFLSRSPAFPNNKKTPLRTVRPEVERSSLKLKVKDAKPPLSYREIEFIERETGMQCDSSSSSSGDENLLLLPWVTGKMYWKINEDHFYAKLAKEFGHEAISGPSRSSQSHKK